MSRIWLPGWIANGAVSGTRMITDEPYKSPPANVTGSHETDPDFKDYGHEVTLHPSRWVRYALIIAGHISVGLGVLGIFLPVLPTTPFLLLAAVCYINSSIWFYNKLMNNRWFGPQIHRWRKEGTVSMRTKVTAISMLALTMGTSIYFFIPVPAVKVLVGLIGLAVAIYLWRLPTTKKKVEHEQ